MPRLSIECPEDKLITLIPILLKEGVKCMVSPNKEVVLIKNLIEINKNVQQTYNEMMSSHIEGNQQVIASGESVPKNCTSRKHVKNRKLTDIVLELFTDTSIILTHEDVGKEIAKLGFAAASSTSALSDLYSHNKLSRIRLKGRTYHYSLRDSNDSNL